LEWLTDQASAKAEALLCSHWDAKVGNVPETGVPVMPRAKRSIHAAVIIEGVSLVWHLHREQQFTADERKGVSIHVKAAEGTFRELFLEYPVVMTQKRGIRTEPLQQHIQPKRIEGHIRLAIAAGWNPSSRGKPFVYQVAELPG
jgi:hypothetical protein